MLMEIKHILECIVKISHFSLCIRMPFILTLQRQLLQEKFHALQKSDLDHVLVQQITIFFILC